MKKKLKTEIAWVEKAYARLQLKTMDKVALSRGHVKAIACGRLDRKDPKFIKSMPLVLARLKAAAVEVLMRESHAANEFMFSKRLEPWKENGIPLEDLSPDQMREAIASDFRSLVRFVTGRKLRSFHDAAFYWGLFDQALDNQLHRDLSSFLCFRLGNLGIEMLDLKHPELNKPHIQQLIEKAGTYLNLEQEKRAATRARQTLRRKGVLVRLPLGDVGLVLEETDHCSAHVPPKGCHSVFAIQNFDFKGPK